MKNILLSLVAVSGLALIAVPVQADPWKDESGKGRFKGFSQGETPWWARGKGYWDGHFKHGRPWGPVPHEERFDHRFGPPFGWAPATPKPHHDDFFKEQWKAQREYEKERYKAWREWQKERAKWYRKHAVPFAPHY